jgi:YYY domain-containing protein
VSSTEAAIRWYVVLVAVSWAFAPLVRWLCPTLPDRGATIARSLAMLFLIYPGWLLASIGVAPYAAPLLVGVMLVAGAGGWVLTLRGEGLDRCWLRALAAAEAASLGAFAAYVWLRGFTPDILGTEKPMDVAFLASSALTAQIPPPDPWFAGEPINYYYLGYLLHGTVARLAGVPPQFAFNLALATAFSTILVAAFGLAWNVLRPALGARLAAAGGLLAAFGLGIAGNLYALLRLIEDAQATWGAWWWDSAVGIGWRSSRIVCDGPRVGNRCEFPSVETINEFPFFSFLLGDLHPHLMALPYTLVVLALACNLARRERAPRGDERPWTIRSIVTGAVAGALYPLNAWDFPTFLLIALLGALAGAGLAFARAWRPILLLAASAIAAWLPFWLSYVPPARVGDAGVFAGVPLLATLGGTIGLHLGERTSVGEYLTIFGVPYAFGVLFVAAVTLTENTGRDNREWRSTAIGIAALLILGVALSAPVIPLCGLPLLLALDAMRRRHDGSARTAALTLFAVAWILSLGVEIVYIRDAFESRMNTLFKFYYQTWTLYALAAALAIPLLWVALERRPWPRAALAGAVALAIIAGLAYPIVASSQWTSRFTVWRGLDGLAFAEETNPDDLAAIRWLQGAAGPGDVVLEAAGCAYQPLTGEIPFNRISAFTGVPSLIGWGDNHQRQWRAGQPELIDEIRDREAAVAAIYAEPGGGLADDFGVTWLVVGDYEAGDWQAECSTAGPYPRVGDPDFPGPGWDEAFRSGDTRVFRSAEPSP